MGKYMGKCRASGVLAVSQPEGVMTRAMSMALAAAEKAAKRRKGVSSAEADRHHDHHQVAYLDLRSRSLVMTPRISRSGLKSSGEKTELVQISRCSSNASCDVGELRSGDREAHEGSESVACCSEFKHETKETTRLSNQSEEYLDLESTAERQARRRSTAMIDAEIEEFFAAAERKEVQRFAETYNYDVVNDVPLEGRCEWIRVGP